MPEFRGTTICAVKRGGKTAIAGDGQVTITDMVRLQAYLLGRGTIQPN